MLNVHAGGSSRVDDLITFPLSGNHAVCGLRGEFGEYDIGGDMPMRTVSDSGSRLTRCAADPQAGNELALERAMSLN